MHVKLPRYVTRRRDKHGERWYWQRPGHKLTRLPDELAERVERANHLNAAADGERATASAARGSIGWVIAKYRESDRYRALEPGTLKYYRRYLNDIEDLGAHLPFAQFDRGEVIEFIETYPRPHQRRQAAAVLKNLFNTARYYGVVKTDHTTDLRLATGTPRDRVWTDDEMTRWLRAAEAEDPHMTTAFMLLAYTAQRPGDVLAMTRAQFDGGAIRLRQQKTGTLLEVPCHPALSEHLATLPKGVMLVLYRGRRVPYLRFNERFRRICKAAGVQGAQARDLRRTAMVRMGEAGATVPQIAAVSGHSIDQTTRILETYLPRNREMAAAAVAKLRDHRKV